MKASFVGDIHGDYRYINRLQPKTIQLGDFDLRGYSVWGNIFTEDEEKKIEIENFNILAGKRYFIDGNHDFFPALNPDSEEPYEVESNLIHIPRGFVSKKTMFIGGADCVPHDRAMRTEGIDWYPEEAITQIQYNRICDTEKEIEVIISHDCPQFVVNELVLTRAKYNGYPSGNMLYSLPSNKAFDGIFDNFKPSLWIFAHHHFSFDKIVRGCRFICLNIGEVRTIDIPLDDHFFDKY